MATFYLDYALGSNTNDGSAFGAGTAWKTLTLGATAARIAPGDIIKIAKSPAPTSLGMTATWTNLSATVTLNSAVTAVIEDCEDAWVASANVTCNTSTTNKEGTNSASMAIAAAFTTGKIAYEALGSSINFSGYRQVSFWIRSSIAVASGVLTLNLCSDTAGATSVNSIAIPAILGANQWQVVTVNTGAALGSSIQSISLNAISDPGTVTILIDNIIACKDSTAADSLTLSSLISKNSAEQGGTEGWYGIQSISGTTVVLDYSTNTDAGVGRGYSGVTETVTTYKRETIKTVPAASTVEVVQEVMDSGTTGNNIQFQGGYDTGTGLQTGETFFDGQNGYGYGISVNSKSYITLNRLNVFRYYQGIVLTSSNNNEITNISNASNNSYGVYLTSSSNNTIGTISNANNNNYAISFVTNCNNNIITTISNANNNNTYGIFISSTCYNNLITTISNANNNGNSGVYFNTNCNNNTITTISNANNNTNYGVYMTLCSNNLITTISNANNNGYGVVLSTSSNNTIGTISNANNNTNYGVFFSSSNNNVIGTLSTTGNTSSGVRNAGKNFIYNSSLAEATEVSSIDPFTNSKIFVGKYDGTAYSKIFTDGGNIVSEVSTLTNGSGVQWKFTTETNTNRTLANNYPLDLSIAKIACSANNLVTVKAWFLKGHATDIGAKLVCRGGQIAGVTSDVVATKANDTSEEELTITFTPTEAGVVEIEAWAYYVSGHSTVIVDAMTITQA